LAGEGNEIEPAEAAAMKGRVFLICVAISGCGATVQENRPGREAIAKMIAFARLGPVPCKRLAPDAESFRALALLTLVKPPLTKDEIVTQEKYVKQRRDHVGLRRWCQLYAGEMARNRDSVPGAQDTSFS
jgi:hypothetical protein